MARREKPAEVRINLAAMLDMAFQLLAFFVMTFKPDPIEGQIQLRLPPPQAIAAVRTNEQAGQDTSATNPVEGVESLIISIYSRPDGGIRSIAVGEGQVGEDSPNKILALEARLRVILDDKDIPFKQVILQVGSRIRYEELMKVIDVCTRQKLPSGEPLTKLSFVELPEGATRGLPEMAVSGRRSAGFFTSRDLMRMVSGILILGIVGMMYLQTRKSSSWASIAKKQEEQESTGPVAPWKERIVENPGYKDLEQQKAFREETQAVCDNMPLLKEEMPAYWRLFKWVYAEPGAKLRKEARKDVAFTHLFQAPDKHRGELLDLRVHVRRMIQHPAPENSAGVQTVYEAWGPTEDSQTFPYCVVFAELPPGMRVEDSPFFDARFVGFFLKKLAYEDATGTKRSAPLIIGRVVYDPVIAVQSQPAQSVLTMPWIIGIVGTLILAIVLVQIWARTPPPRSPARKNDEATVDAFLTQLEGDGPTSEGGERDDKPPPNPSIDHSPD